MQSEFKGCKIFTKMQEMSYQSDIPFRVQDHGEVVFIHVIHLHTYRTTDKLQITRVLTVHMLIIWLMYGSSALSLTHTRTDDPCLRPSHLFLFSNQAIQEHQNCAVRAQSAQKHADERLVSAF